MFDITSSKLLILGIVALLVIGPKDLPALLRTIGKYIGIIKRQAAEFRAQFDEAMRESEFADLKRDVESLGREAEQSMRAAEQSVEKDWAQAKESVNAALDAPTGAAAAEPPAPSPEPAPAEAEPRPLNGSAENAELGGAAAPAPATPEGQHLAESQHAAAPQVEKSGA
ncbi:MAG TPA: Sec-independent protein translocase protein TatB [Hyphomicrobiaceae bacterium]|jgi:sec-independent protein translocase protein TatB|nr:Sec-independent protein translocase protein TatB [Hyphomicrobiaceae bacterium]